MNAPRRRLQQPTETSFGSRCPAMPAEDAYAEASASSTLASEALACVSCRARKLKCDRTKPACSRCTKVSGECVYPESRRKPAFKRRNVKELEARLGSSPSPGHMGAFHG